MLAPSCLLVQTVLDGQIYYLGQLNDTESCAHASNLSCFGLLNATTHKGPDKCSGEDAMCDISPT